MRSDDPDRPRRWAARPLISCFLGLLGLTALAACKAPAPERDLLAPTEEQMKLRSYQTRVFDVADRTDAMRAVLAALQDLGFLIERANETMGLITAARFAEPYSYDVVAVTVTVRAETDESTRVRVNAIHDNRPIEDPQVYSNFFATLERSLLALRNE